jgi:putative component of membrane protein insertase Oxa1/YidC/SpoIIIJ protein YidD
MLRFFIRLGIKGYQKFISPRKGYRCAYSVRHGGSGCSGAVLQIIEENSIFTWRKLIKERFSNCKIAYEEIKKEKKRRKNKKCDSCEPDTCKKERWKKSCDLSDTCDCDVLDCDVGSCD